ncbi:MAG: peptide deformylase [Candidatus Omnitrophica bacterium]|nr:peptide deformylase [Candidatus Omnitrophota bacterium]
MAILEIRKFPDEILRRKATAVGAVTAVEKKLIQDMFETMNFARGVGLAAPQVGVSKRIIVCNPTGEKADELAIINPVITCRKGKRVKDCEGCLSIPAMSGEVTRYSLVGVKGKDPEGKEFSLEAADMLARIVDHEMDHLNGVLFIDRMGFLKRKLLIAKYKKKMGITCLGRRYC